MLKPKKKKIFVVSAIILAILSFSTTALAAEGQQGADPVTALNGLVTFILSIVTVVGVIACIWGGVSLSLALKSQDASQRTSAILYLAGGAIMVGIRFVLQALGVAVGA